MDQLMRNPKTLIVFLTVMVFLPTAWVYLFSNADPSQGHWSFMDTVTTLDWQIITQLRLPRLLMAAINGLVLAVAGAITQALFKNPLAAPSLIGISSGASLFSAAAILATSSVAIPMVKQLSIPLAAFLGGTLTCFLVFRLSRLKGSSNITILILAGIAINAITGALLGLLLYLADDASLRSITFWSMGSIGAQKWSTVMLNMGILVIVLICALKLAKALNGIALGEDLARHVGYSVEKVKVFSILLVALGVGISVSFCGLIGFIGLIIPHMSRMVFGAEMKQTILGCCILGPSLMIIADYISKSIVFPAELPIGIVSSGIGGPFFIYLLLRLKYKGSTV